MLERTHINFSDQSSVDVRLVHDKRHEDTEIRNDQVRLIMSSRVESRERKAAIL